MLLVPPAVAVPVTAEANTVLPIAQPRISGSQSGAVPGVPEPLTWTVDEKLRQPPVNDGGLVSNPPTISFVVAFWICGSLVGGSISTALVMSGVASTPGPLWTSARMIWLRVRNGENAIAAS